MELLFQLKSLNNKKMKYFCIINLFLSFALLGCNYTNLKQTAADDSQKFSLPEESVQALSYSVISQKIFSSRCVSCHGNSGNINLESYTEVKRNLDLIKKTVFDEKTMPKKGVLTDEELSYLWVWIKLGAPEQAQNGTAEPVPEPILPTYESINKNVFQTSCKDCHTITGTGKRILLDKESLLNSPLELVIPGNPDESGLVLAVERNDNKRMPSAKEGYAALKADAKAAIRKWIENGASD